MRTEKFAEFVKGVALGDSLGMLGENLSRAQIQKLYPDGVRQKMPFKRGFLSDETEQVLLTARALCRRNASLPLRVSFRRELLWWMATLPIGAGTSTVRSCISIAFMSRLRLTTTLAPGGPSKGNGPLLRAATIGLLHDGAEIHQASTWTTLLTHTSLEAVTCSVITARIFSKLAVLGPTERLSAEMFREAAYYARAHLDISHSDYGWVHELRPFVASLEPAFSAIDLVESGEITLEEGLMALGCGDGVSGHVVQTLLASLMIAVRHQDCVNAAADAAVLAGGDTDSVAALACGLVAVATSEKQDYSRLTLWRDPYRLTAEDPPDGEHLLRLVETRRHRIGILLEHLALMFVAAPAFLTRRAYARWMP